MKYTYKEKTRSPTAAQVTATHLDPPRRALNTHASALHALETKEWWGLKDGEGSDSVASQRLLDAAAQGSAVLHTAVRSDACSSTWERYRCAVQHTAEAGEEWQMCAIQ